MTAFRLQRVVPVYMPPALVCESAATLIRVRYLLQREIDIVCSVGCGGNEAALRKWTHCLVHVYVIHGCIPDARTLFPWRITTQL